MDFPSISIITPCLNQARFLEATVRSVLDQAYPRLEYILIDGGSTDGSLDIVRKYADRLAYWVSEPDRGHYDAVNKGFGRATGDILGWLNADDLLVPRSLQVIGEVFAAFPEIQWITGIPAVWDTQDRLIAVAERAPVYGQRYLQAGENDARILPGVQQESCFWRRELWLRSGGTIREEWSLAGDYELWTRMARVAPLVTVGTVLAGNRRHPGQRSAQGREEYFRQMNAISAGLRCRTWLRQPWIQRLRRCPGGHLFYRAFFAGRGELLQWEGDPHHPWVKTLRRVM